MTRWLIGANLAVWALAWGGEDVFPRLVMQGDAVVVGHEWYRMLSSVFLHEPSVLGVLHIAVNLWSLWILGPLVEAELGRLRYLAVYLLAGVGGAALVMQERPALMVAGASGAVLGLAGALLVIGRRGAVGRGGGAGLRTVLAVLLVNLVATFSLGFVAWETHLGGLMVGALLAAGFVHAPARYRVPVQWLAVGAVAALVAGVSLHAAAHVVM